MKLTVTAPWYLRAYLKSLLYFSMVTGLTPDYDKAKKVTRSFIKISVDKGDRECSQV